MKAVLPWCLRLAAVFATSAWAAAGGPTDPQIAAIVVAANQVDIDAGELAKSRASNAQVKEFAQRMITDHTGVNKSATDLVTRLHVTPEANDTSRSLQKGGDDNLAALKKLSGSAFDKALIPNAKNAELKALLVKVRPAFVAHLDHARHLQGQLGAG